nr:DUF1080 domain-containing protein [Saprospiraceae bacterium]
THLGTKSLSFLNRALKASDDQTASKIIGVLSDQADIPLEPFLKDAQRFPLNAQVALVSVAEKRGDRSALGLVRRLLSSRDAGAQAYGLHALSSLSGEASLGELLAFVKQAKNGLSAAAAAEEIGRYVGAHNLQIVPDALHQSTPHGKVALINLMADRKMSQFFNTVSDLAGSGETEVADAIFSKLTSLSKGVQMSKLIHLIPQAKDEMHVNNLVQALTHRYSASEGDRKMLMQTFEESTTAEIAGRTMAAIGDEDLLVYLNQRMLETGGYPNHARRSILHWSQPNALPTLLGLVQSKDEEVGRDAGAQAVRLTRQQNSTQRLLTLRRLLQVCDVASVRQQAIGELGRTYTIPAVRFLSSFLQDTVLSSAAAGALIRIGQEAASNPMPLGAEDHEAMSAAVKLLGEEVNPYAAAELRSLLDAGPMEKPFRSLFNGQNLDGWQGLVQNPIARSKMSMAERKAAQSTADSIMHLSWFVENGEIRFEGDGYDNLCTAVESFQDFELYMDWKIEKDGDSGVYLRGSPQIQIWDPDRENAGSGSGGLFNNQVHTKEPSHRADNPVGEWNTFRILMIDNKVTVYLNGELVTDHVILENYWDREQRIFRRGPIELQAHTTPLAFRDLFIREIEGAAQLNSGEQQDGFTHLYNGVNLDGWIGNTTDYVSEDGEIVIYPTLSGGSGNLMTEKEYSNFILRFEFLLTPGANNGLGIHAPMKGDAAYLGKELQILDNTAEIYAKLKPYQYHGSAYGIAPAKRGFQRPIGEWNMQEVEVRGNKIKVTLNNEVILDADLDALSADGTMDGRDHPGLKKLKGHIGFLGHGSEVRFRNIRIKELVD